MRNILLTITLCGTVAATAVADSYESVAVDEGSVEMPFKVNVDVRGGYDDNVNTSSGVVITDPATGDTLFADAEQESWFVGADLKLSRDFGGPRTKFNISLGAGLTYYLDLPENDVDYNFRLKADFSHKFNRKFTLTAYASVAYMIEPDFFNASAVTRTRRNGHYLFANAGLSLNYQWTRKFSTRTGYQFTGLRYDDGGASTLDNRMEHYFKQEFRFLVHPKTTLLAEYRYGIVDYESNPRNSTSHYALAGFEHSFSPRFSLTARGGAEWRSYDVGGDTTKPYGEATLSYAYGERSSVSWVTRYGLESNDTLLTNNLTLRTGIQVVHGFTPKLAGNLSFYYQNSDHDSDVVPGYADNLYQLNAGLTYSVTQMFNIGAYYSYTRQESDIDFREYDRSRYSIGAGLAF